MKLKPIHHQPSWELKSDKVRAYLTRQGGHLGPVYFQVGKREIQPFDIAPWAENIPKGTIPLLQIMRGDFFCMPFGGNARKRGAEQHPPHGETSQSEWTLDSAAGESAAVWSMRTKIRPGLVLKKLSLVPGQTAVYQRHEIHGMKGPMNLGHHAILKFPDAEGSGAISMSPFAFGQVYPGQFEKAEEGGYSALKPGSIFKKLEKVELNSGGYTDLSRYPARRGYEDLVMMMTKPAKPFAWTAVTFAREKYVWFALKDPAVLRQTVFWHSNGGRHYPPWSSRHISALGIEEVTSYFHEGLAESTAPNLLTKKGIVTSLELSPKRPTTINYIMALAEIPAGFDRVKAIRADGAGGVVLEAASGRKVKSALNWNFLFESATSRHS